MTISLTQAILLGLFCGIAKCCIPYTAGAFMYNTVIFNAVIVGAVLGDMPQAMMIGASLQLIYLGVIAAGGNQPTDPCLAAYVAIPVAMASGLNTNAAVEPGTPWQDLYRSNDQGRKCICSYYDTERTGKRSVRSADGRTQTEYEPGRCEGGCRRSYGWKP